MVYSSLYEALKATIRQFYLTGFRCIYIKKNDNALHVSSKTSILTVMCLLVQMIFDSQQRIATNSMLKVFETKGILLDIFHHLP